MGTRALIAALALSVALITLFWERDALAGPYDQGKVRVAVTAGTGNAFGHNYFSAHLGVGYFVLDGLEVGVDGEQWFGSGPSLTKVSPQLRYVLQLGSVAPYVGIFYKHWFVGDDLPDADTVGGRGGLFTSVFDGHGVVGLGLAAEHLVSECEADCTSVYPEVTFFLSF